MSMAREPRETKTFYRWATIPVVKIAQEELAIEMPPELDMPWRY